MSSSDKQRATGEGNGVKRRDFLRGTGLAAGAAVGAAALTVVETPAAAQAADSGSASGYHETDHVRRVYETARF